MSLLLKALKQAESAHADKAGAGGALEGDLELEPLGPGTAKAREWVEPPGLLFASGGAGPDTPRTRWRMPRLSLVPLTALLAVLVGVGYGVYLYFELQPPAPPPALAGAVAPAAPPQAIESAPPSAPMPAAEPTAAPRDGAVAAGVPARPAEPSAEARVPVSPAGSPATRSAPSTAAPRFQPDLQAGLLAQAYAAYQRGALTEAQRLYSQAVARNRNVDALLGLAAIASVQNRDADAQRLYREVLDLDPRNAAAQGALLDLLGNTDSHGAESRLKALIERDPSPQLHQTLGNLYADQGRWNEAQAAYFEAYRGAPDNADYAYNLAVSLDQLNQYPAALTYYEKALAAGGVHRFDRAQAEARVQQLRSAR